MVAQLCNHKLTENVQLVHFHGTFMITFCVLILALSFVATLGNLLIIRALWKASSIPATLKKLFLSLAASDFAVGLFAQLMFGIIIAVMLNMAANGNSNFGFLCPSVLTVCYFVIYLLTCASFLTIVVIAIDRVLAVFLHLRYQELVTSRPVVIALVSLWLISAVAASLYISLPDQNNMIIVIFEFVGLLVTTVGYIRIYKIVRYHQSQIQSQFQLQNNQAMEILREKKSTINALLVYIVFVACFLRNLCCIILLRTDGLRLSFLVANHVSGFLVLLNSSLNPMIYCWRYREIRAIVKAFVKSVFVTENRISDGLQL
ncbi:melanocyte-stimulating hormone receptor-like [Oculina patagonica]